MAEHSSYKDFKWSLPNEPVLWKQINYCIFVFNKRNKEKVLVIKLYENANPFQDGMLTSLIFFLIVTLEFSHQIPSTVKLYSFQNCIYMQRQAFTFGRQKFS